MGLSYSLLGPFCFIFYHLHAPGHANNLLAVDVHVDNNNLSVNCSFLESFQGVAYCEIKLIDSVFTHLEIREQSQEGASAGGSVLINNVTLNASTVYLYNVSAVLEDESTPAVVVQGVITTPPTTAPPTSEFCTWFTIIISHINAVLHSLKHSDHIQGNMQYSRIF